MQLTAISPTPLAVPGHTPTLAITRTGPYIYAVAAAGQMPSHAACGTDSRGRLPALLRPGRGDDWRDRVTGGFGGARGGGASTHVRRHPPTPRPTRRPRSPPRLPASSWSVT